VTHRAACLQHTVHADCLAGCVRRPPPYLFCSAPRTVLCALPPVDWDVIVVRAPVPLAQGWVVYSRAKFPEFGFQQRMESSRASPPHTGRERMGSPTLQALQDPILLLLPWAAFDWRLSNPQVSPLRIDSTPQSIADPFRRDARRAGAGGAGSFARRPRRTTTAILGSEKASASRGNLHPRLHNRHMPVMCRPVQRSHTSWGFTCLRRRH
jgi:hypothetical protein